MAIYTVAELINTLKDNYSPTEEIVCTWWTKDDVSLEFEEDFVPAEKRDEVWENTKDELNWELDAVISQVNDGWMQAVSDYLPEED